MNVALRCLYKIPASKERPARIFIPKYNEKSETSECVRTEDEAWEIEEDG